jgi:hypothetical protein
MTTLQSNWATGKDRKIGPNTYARTDASGARSMRYHSTDVATLLPDGSMVLNSGGWRTTTTMDRINHALGNRARVWSDRGQWYLHPLTTGVCGGDPVRFWDGITVRPDGTATPGPHAALA